MDEVVLEARAIDKSFSGIKVLHAVSMDVRRGEVHALMGENGAGKSTLMRILIGILRSDGGQVRIDGKPVSINTPRQAMDHGIAMIHQELNPVLDMRVYENIYLGREPRTRLRLADHARMKRDAAELLEAMDVSVPADAYMRDLSIAQCQQVEIAKALSVNARVVIMDEPTSAITDDDAEHLFGQIRRMTADGVGVIYISHKMEEIFRIADRITVLRDGQHVTTGPAAEFDEPALIKAMVGRSIDDVFPKREVPLGEPALEIRDWNVPQRVQDVSFTLRHGEILGIGGLVGAGRSELVESLFGFGPRGHGTVLRNGKTVQLRRPRDAMRQGIALITEDRKRTGLNLVGTILENVTLPSLGKLFARGLISPRKEKRAAGRYVDSLRVKAASLSQGVAELSGGNQQKVVLAKWMLTQPDVVILDEPTRGIDVGAKRDIYELIGGLVEQGKAVILISSEMGELIGLSDRILVLAEGRCTGTLQRSEFSQEAVMELASRFEG
ncbi:sugar ABC transporter ATP-binding protein [Actinomyces sp. MRS3W]|uniref:sugar ABC transporter ATP-binding protein n=1 Tax=Actinomyces sp. MRS3W TaxID=2800796 RepID=UPI0028FD3890|nr:sugar ABC transporter ATP-binding protein [Actinomyces sp. MRS3W]MDU0349806.1 sugar ABC transporter ATP-binding protein [Actinomyces sp. MRS3W]